jgi:DNA modification methylase
LTTLAPVHPFPARMAPELALGRLPQRVAGDCTVLDPMMGSGTIPVIAAMQGYRAIGIDSDPLAVLIARTTGRAIDGDAFLDAARTISGEAGFDQDALACTDVETQDFIDYWFDPETQTRLAALAARIMVAPEELRDPLWCAFSRLIITKDVGASLARDVSHSRPHRVRDKASFDPIERFPVSAKALLDRHRRLAGRRPAGHRLRLFRGDARSLKIEDNSIDLVMTSPPYLQAIDYLRGHRMSLVWMGYSIGELRELRSSSIGSERMAELKEQFSGVIPKQTAARFGRRGNGILARYTGDVGIVLGEVERVLRSNGQATFVVADATLEGEKMPIASLVIRIASRVGLELVDRSTRSLPRGSRYLPPPDAKGSNSLDRRMKVEHRLTFSKPA